MKFIISIFLLLSAMHGSTTTAQYKVSFGMFGKMGVSDALLELKDNGTYHIKIDAKTTGLAKVLSGNRYEVYESFGDVISGKLVPHTFTKLRKTNTKRRLSTYKINHLSREVTLETIDTKKGKTNTHTERFKYYAQNDILSLFFNLKKVLKTQANQTLYAIGGNKKDGKIDIILPKDKALEQMKQTMKMSEGSFLKVILNQKIFSSNKGELLINLDKDGFTNKAILKDVLLFGDIVGIRVK